MKNLTKKQAIDILVNAAKDYETALKGKHFLIVYRTRRGFEYVTIGFRDYNFLHLTGVKTNLKAQVFYSACLNKRLSEKDIDLNTSGKAQQKLSVLPYLHTLLFNHCMIGTSLNGGVYINSDYFVGNTKTFLSVGFRSHKSVDIPITLYNSDIRQLTKPTYKIVAIFSKKYNEDKFNTCTYYSDTDITQISNDIKSLLDTNLNTWITDFM